MVRKRKKQPNGEWKLEEVGLATFHAFGLDYEEFEAGAGNFSTAIVEWEDGSVENIPVNHVRFIL